MTQDEVTLDIVAGLVEAVRNDEPEKVVAFVAAVIIGIGKDVKRIADATEELANLKKAEMGIGTGDNHGLG